MWYYALGDQRMGPVPEDEIVRLIAAGTVRIDTLVWTDGMSAWATVAQTPLSSHLPPAPPPPPAAPSPPGAPSPPQAWPAQAAGPQPGPMYSPNPPLPQYPAGEEIRTIEDLFKWYWICWLVGIVCCLPWIGAVIIGWVLIYKYWTIVSDGYARTSPGLAVGLSFVPLFHLYWVFVAVLGLTQDMNSYCKRHGIPAPPASESLGLWHCILSIGCAIPYLNLLVIPFQIVVTILLHKSLKETATAILRHRMAGAPVLAARV
jgi:hypothetical protein